MYHWNVENITCPESNKIIRIYFEYKYLITDSNNNNIDGLLNVLFNLIKTNTDQKRITLKY